jgi:hypothetical protein
VAALDRRPEASSRGQGHISRLREGATAGLVAGLAGGVPSSVHAFVTGRDALESTRAAGSVLLRDEDSSAKLFVAGVVAHLAISLGWGVVLRAFLPERNTPDWGAAAGLGVAVLDLGVVGRRFPRIRALPTCPQIADHVAYGFVAGLILRQLRSG